jgi:glyoxylase I family protein
MLQGIHHIAIICSNYERSKDFYTRILGFETIAEHYRAERESWKLDLRVDAHTAIELFSFPQAPARPSYPEAAGLRHLAFKVTDMDAMVERLASFNIICEPIRVDAYTHQRFTFFADPDGLPLELYEISAK